MKKARFGWLGKWFPGICICCIISTAQAKTSIAILPFDSTNIRQTNYLKMTDFFKNKLVNSNKYVLVDREIIEKVLKEQSLGLSGVVDPSTTSRVGRMIGVEKIIRGKVYYSGKAYGMSYEVIDVETGKVEYTKTQTSVNVINPPSWAAGDIMIRYPLLGTITGLTEGGVIISLGAGDGLKNGQRVFWARTKTVKDSKGAVVFTKTERLGLLTVSDVGPTSSVAVVRSAQQTGIAPSEGDQISPDPLPRKDAVVSRTPFFPEVRVDRSLLEDDMRKDKYLSPKQNKGEGYTDGHLVLDATALKTGQSYGYYPPPFDTLTSCMITAEMRFLLSDGSAAGMSFRCTDPVSNDDKYSLYITDNGKIFVGVIVNKIAQYIVNGESTPALNRNGESNTLKVIAIGPRFDCYINDTYVLSFEDENYEAGAVGLFVESGGRVQFDNVRIWSVR
jgi:hypothetical protein